MINKQIEKSYHHKINIERAGLAAISISARCKSKKQGLNADEDLRIELDGVCFRENFPQKNIQKFNIPVAFNGSKLKGLKKTITILVVLDKGEHILSLIPKNSAFVESIKIQELSGAQDVEFKIEDQAEDGNNRPWHTFAIVDLPLSEFSADITVKKRFWDSDDVKVILNGKIKKNIGGGKYRFWHLVGGILGWTVAFMKGKFQRNKINFKENLDTGVHYLEFWADRMPILHRVKLNLRHTETKAEKRASMLITECQSIIKQSAKEFGVDPVMLGAVIYQEQSTNVDFIDTLTDYIGGLLYINTSIGVGQVRVNTAESLERFYPELKISCNENSLVDCNMLRVECLKMPLLNVRYAAAKIKFSQDRWGKAGFDIKNRPEILGTLYNIEDVDKPIDPHDNPEPNNFGKGAEKNFNKVKELLSL